MNAVFLLEVHPVLFHIGAVLIPAYGAFAALGVLLALAMVPRTARMAGVNPGQLWNVCVVALFAALVGARLLLVAANWSVLRTHPLWLLALATIHHPLVALAGVLTGVVAAAVYGWRRGLPLWPAADALAAPFVLGSAFEQLGSLLAGSGYGRETTVRWAITYTNPLAERWSGTPIGIPVHPVQAYAALAFITLALILVIWLPVRRQPGDVAGVGLIGIGVAVFFTEFWRDSEGRGSILGGALDWPQLAAVVLVLGGALVLLERKGLVARPGEASAVPPFPQKDAERMGHGGGGLTGAPDPETDQGKFRNFGSGNPPANNEVTHV